ncbi:MAG: hypothetical protein WCS43_02735 [Verrucomicrobiota bacterium]
MIANFSRILTAIITLSTTSICRAEEPSAPHWPQAELNRLPLLYFEKNELDEASLHRLDPANQTVTIDGQSYLGFHFWSTIWHDGPIEWLIASSAGATAPKPWLVIADDGRQLATVTPEARTLESHPRIVARFPQTATISYVETPPDLLVRLRHYYLLQPVEAGNTAMHAITFAVKSRKGYSEYGKLNQPKLANPRRESSDQVVAQMIELRREKGIDAATAYATREIELRMDDWEKTDGAVDYDLYERSWWTYERLHGAIYREAQLGGGRLDRYWSSCIYDTLFTVSRRRGYYVKMINACTSLCNSMASAGRYGRQTEVLEMWSDAMRQSGYRMNPTSYPDLGPAFPFLPTVRHRDIPILIPFAHVKHRNMLSITLPKDFSQNNAETFLNYAHQQWRGGQWREALEWNLWMLKWASEETDGEPRRDRANLWHSSFGNIANYLSDLGFNEEALALYEKGLKARYDGWYQGRALIQLDVSRLDLMMELDRPVPDLVKQLEDLVVRSKGNIYLSASTCQRAETILAKALIRTGHQAEGEALFDRLAGEGCYYARWGRIEHWISNGRVEGVENEFIALLTLSRESGNKAGEFRLYSMYADFLESQGRDREALMIRREAIRLCRSFDYFTKLPAQLARLAVLLERLGNTAASQTAEKEARQQLDAGQIPPSLADATRKTLDQLHKQPKPVTVTKDNNPSIDFQPTHSVAIPLKNAPWTTLLTLSNPSGHAEEGTLSATGLPVRMVPTEDGPGEVEVTLGATDGASTLPLRVEPGNYQLIAVTAGDGLKGEVTLLWTPRNGGAPAQSQLSVKAAEDGVASAVIQAGNYRYNPFYGVPIHHHYVTKEKTNQSLPLRFVTSGKARVEVYDLEGKPLAIDSKGNGSLQDRGDELFGASDGHGNLVLPLTDGADSFMVLLYPDGPLPKEGLTLRIEAFGQDSWTLHAEDRLVP